MNYYIYFINFSVGPWNVHEGADAFGPEVRSTIAFEKKVETFKKIGFDAVQFHDDDAVPDMNDLSDSQIKTKARDVKKSWITMVWLPNS